MNAVDLAESSRRLWRNLAHHPIAAGCAARSCSCAYGHGFSYAVEPETRQSATKRSDRAQTNLLRTMRLLTIPADLNTGN